MSDLMSKFLRNGFGGGAERAEFLVDFVLSLVMNRLEEEGA